MSRRYQHDFDEELGTYFYGHSSSNTLQKVARKVAGVNTSGLAPLPPRRTRNEAYWDETCRLVTDYFELKAGTYDSEMLFDGFIAWLERSPAERRQYIWGDDMRRAALVDWFLRVVQ